MLALVLATTGCDDQADPNTLQRFDDPGVASAWSPPGNGTPVTALVEPLDENGLDSRVATWFEQAPLPPTYPPVASDCLRSLAAEAFAELPGSTSMTWVATMHDPWPVAPIEARYIDALDGAGRWGQGAWETARMSWKTDRASATAAALSALQTVVDGVTDCDIVDTFEVLPFAVLECTVAGAQALWTDGHLLCLDADEEPEEQIDDTCTVPSAECGDNMIYPIGHRGTARCHSLQSRLSVLEGHGLRPFLPNPFTVDASMFHSATGTPAMRAIAMETWVPPTDMRDHPGFLRAGSGARRLMPFEACAWYAGKTRCRSDSSRVEPYVDSVAHPHMSGTATHLLGSVTGGQQPVRDPFDCDLNPDWSPSTHPSLQAEFGSPADAASFEELEKDSAFARDVSGHLMAVQATSRAYLRAIERAIVIDDSVLLNASFSRRSSDTSPIDCDGVHDKAVAISHLFWSGDPFFKSAGNYNNEERFEDYSALECNIGGPGGAIAAFVVGALNGPNGQRRNSSSNADATARRTLVDVAANGALTRPWYSRTPDPERALLYHQNSFSATSLATPTVAGAAISFRHYYETLPGSPTAIRLPGLLYARLLLQADRAGFTTTDPSTWTEVSLSSGYDVNVGAGRLRMDLIFNAGTIGYNGSNFYHRGVLTQSRRSMAGTVCVGNGITQIPLPEVSGFATPLTVTAYFHDPMHPRTGSLDEITMHLMRVEGSSMSWVASDDNRQEKMRIHHELDAADWYLMLRGHTVTGASGGCSANQQRVYFAYKWTPNTEPEHIPWHFE